MVMHIGEGLLQRGMVLWCLAHILVHSKHIYYAHKCAVELAKQVFEEVNECSVCWASETHHNAGGQQLSTCGS